MKTVKFQDEEYQVEDWVNFITIDEYGRIEAWKTEPQISGSIWINGDYNPDCYMELKNLDIQMTKMKV